MAMRISDTAMSSPRMASAHISATLRYKFIALVGNEYVRATTAADAVAGAQPELAIAPGTDRGLAEVLRLSNEAGLAGVFPRRGTKIPRGNPAPPSAVALLTSRLNRYIR